MASMLRNCFPKKNPASINDRVYSKDDYDDMFVIPKKLMSYTTIRMTHNITGNRAIFWNVMYWLTTLNVIFGIVTETLSMLKTAAAANTFQDVTKILTMVPCAGLSAQSLFKSLKIKYNRTTFEKLHHELRELWPTGEILEEEHRIISSQSKQFKFIAKGYYWCSNALLLSFAFPPVYNYLLSMLGFDAPMVLPFLYWLPFNPYQPVLFEMMLVLQTWAAVTVAWSNTAWNLLFCMYIAHIEMQFVLVSRRVHRLIHVPMDRQLINSYPLAQMSKELIEDNRQDLNPPLNDGDLDIRQHIELVSIVKRHHALIRLAADVENIVSSTLLINFLNSSIIICMCGFCSVLLEKWTEVAYKSFFMAALAEIWLLCWYGQKLIDSSLGLSQALYECGWYNSSKQIKSAILLMLLRAQKGVAVTTYGYTTMSLFTYSKIIKTSWSYFTLLLNCTKNKEL